MLWDNPKSAFEDEFDSKNIQKMNEQIKSTVIAPEEE